MLIFCMYYHGDRGNKLKELSEEIDKVIDDKKSTVHDILAKITNDKNYNEQKAKFELNELYCYFWRWEDWNIQE